MIYVNGDTGEELSDIIVYITVTEFERLIGQFRDVCENPDWPGETRRERRHLFVGRGEEAERSILLIEDMGESIDLCETRM